MYPVEEIDRSRQRPNELDRELHLVADVRRWADTPRKRGIVPQSDVQPIIARDAVMQDHRPAALPSPPTRCDRTAISNCEHAVLAAPASIVPASMCPPIPGDRPRPTARSENGREGKAGG